MCVLLPMAAARGVHDVPTALKAIRISSTFFVLSCLITLATHDSVGWVTISLIWLGHVTVTGAELYLSAASWSFEAELMDPRRRGAYQGAAELSSTLGKVWAPALYTFLAMNWGAVGWLVIAGIIVVATVGVVTPRLRGRTGHRSLSVRRSAVRELPHKLCGSCDVRVAPRSHPPPACPAPGPPCPPDSGAGTGLRHGHQAPVS
jgi:MFS family permease